MCASVINHKTIKLFSFTIAVALAKFSTESYDRNAFASSRTFSIGLLSYLVKSRVARDTFGKCVKLGLGPPFGLIFHPHITSPRKAGPRTTPAVK